MVWEPFALAVLFGLLISAGIYFVVMWPQVAPDDDALDAADPPGALAVAAVSPVADSPLADSPVTDAPVADAPAADAAAPAEPPAAG
ncbi:MAG: hypothetical protein IPH44_27655 [Myxococcales bacterium]|jgi:hypothetical protein|nr:hypothetical protein [Myxococcales bacterium]MBK7196225.1 hypothetical protein [Myxococcales bacterium]MBP6846999.1 hypothetical protein [Kofleriaceae bacterium]